MITFKVYYGDRFIGTVKAYNRESAYRIAAYEYRHWCGGYGDSIRIVA